MYVIAALPRQCHRNIGPRGACSRSIRRRHTLAGEARSDDPAVGLVHVLIGRGDAIEGNGEGQG